MKDQETPTPGSVSVRFGDVAYPLVTELTEREKFEAERISGRSLDELPKYTAALVLAYFTLKRAGYDHDFDAFLDRSGFEFEETEPPLELPESEPAGESNGALTETDGIPTSPRSSVSIPG